jgi:hypothetical protein
MFLYGSNKSSNLFVLQLFKIFSILLLLQLYFKCKESLHFFFLLLLFQLLHTTLIHFLYSSPKIFCNVFPSTHYTSWRILLMRSLLYIFQTHKWNYFFFNLSSFFFAIFFVYYVQLSINLFINLFFLLCGANHFSSSTCLSTFELSKCYFLSMIPLVERSMCFLIHFSCTFSNFHSTHL